MAEHIFSDRNSSHFKRILGGLRVAYWKTVSSNPPPCKVIKACTIKVLPSSQTYHNVFMPCGVQPLQTPITAKQVFLLKFSQAKHHLLLNFLVKKSRVSPWLHNRATVHCYFASCMKTGVPSTSSFAPFPSGSDSTSY